MATTFTQTLLNVIYAALRKVNGYADGQLPDASKVDDARVAMNYLLADLEAEDVYFLQTRDRTKTFETSDSVLVGSDSYRRIKTGTSPNASTWAGSTAYSVGDLALPSTDNGYYAECTAAGTSDSSEPTWGADNDAEVTDNTVTWTMRPDTAPGTGKAWRSVWYLDAGITATASYARNTKYYCAGDFELRDDEFEIVEATIRYNDLDFPVNIISSREWSRLKDKISTGMPTVLHQEITGNNSILVHLREMPDQVGDDGYILNYKVRIRHTTYTSTSTNVDAPSSMFRLLRDMLALEIADEWMVPEEQILRWRVDVDRLKSRVLERWRMTIDSGGIRPSYRPTRRN